MLILNKVFKNLNIYINSNQFLENNNIKNKNIFNKNNNFFNFFKNFNFFYIPNIIPYLFYYNYNYYYYYLNNKSIKFNKIYFNFFKKNNYYFNSFFYNLSIKNNFYLYKLINKTYITRKVEIGRFKKKALKKIKFFKIKKNKENLNLSFLNVFNSFHLKKINKKKINNIFIKSLKFNFFSIFDNIKFNKKININEKIILNSDVIFKILPKRKLFNIIYYYNNLISYLKLKPYIKKNKKKGFYKFLNVDLNLINFYFYNKVLIYNETKKKLFKNLSTKSQKIFLKFEFNFKIIFKIIYKVYFSNFILYFLIKNKKNIFVFIKNKPKYHKINRFNKLSFIIFKNIIYINDLYEFNNYFNKYNLLFSNIFFKNMIILDNYNLNKFFFKNFEKYSFKNLNLKCYNNYYPIFYSHKKSYKLFVSKFKSSLNVDYLIFMNFYVVSFLESFFKKRIFLKISNNFFNKTPNSNVLFKLYNEYKNFQPNYMKSFSLKDFFEIIWYSFFLKDLNLITEWFCKFMESINFKFHKRFITFFQNFIIKHQKIFFGFFNIKGFFFDIRGKVGVTGNSKKRHHFFKIGRISKSTKIKKINFKQSLVRTPSGVLGVTIIISY